MNAKVKTFHVFAHIVFKTAQNISKHSSKLLFEGCFGMFCFPRTVIPQFLCTHLDSSRLSFWIFGATMASIKKRSLHLFRKEECSMPDNTQGHTRQILIFGDSNTYGYNYEGDRFDESVRYPCLLQSMLGPKAHIIEEGLPGRTCVFEDPLHEGMNGLTYLAPCMMSHGPLDTLVIMLGTNDTNPRYGCNAFYIGQGMARLVQKALSVAAWRSKPDILIVAPCPLLPNCEDPISWECLDMDAVDKSRRLAVEYARIAQELGCRFLDAGSLPGIQVNRWDGTHLTPDGHRALAEGLAPLLL